MSIWVTDPAGVEWTVSRDWFGLPEWVLGSGSESPAWELPVIGEVPDGDGSGALGILFVLALVVFLALVFLWFLVPVLLFLIGLLAATFALVLRLLSISSWTVGARTADRSLIWRIRGVRRSRQAMHNIARALAGGREPTVDGFEGFSL